MVDNLDFEDRERKRRRQFIKVVIAEIGMVLAIIAVVIVATLSAMGFFVSSNGTIEQSGLIQIHSMPTGASIELDGSTIFSRTNTSRTLTPGEHTIKLSKDGYDTWEKTIKMYAGMLIRLYYPRLFLLNREAETVMKLGEALEFYSTSTDYNNILYAVTDSVEWVLVDIRNDDVRTIKLDMSSVLPGVEKVAGKAQFQGSVDEIKWTKNSDYVLVRTTFDGKSEWILVSLKDVKQSLNLTRTFGLEFSQVELIDGTANQLFVLENQQLRKINTNDRTISRVLLSDVQSFACESTNVIYVATKLENSDDGEKKVKVIGVYRDGERGGTTLARMDNEDVVRVSISKYYDDNYLGIFVNDEVTVYYGAIPSYREKMGETDFSGLKVLVEKTKLSLIPDRIDVSSEGEYMVARHDRQFVVIDLDMGDIYEYKSKSAKLHWLDTSMMSAVVDGELVVWDFDNTNQRILVTSNHNSIKSDDSVTTFSNAELMNYVPVITMNNKWIYYTVKSGDEAVLVREKIRD